MTGPVHFSDVGWQIVHDLDPRKDPDMTDSDRCPSKVALTIGTVARCQQPPHGEDVDHFAVVAGHWTDDDERLVDSAEAVAQRRADLLARMTARNEDFRQRHAGDRRQAS